MDESMEEDGHASADRRRYYCEYCGIGRSKKCLITAHTLIHHKEEIKQKEEEMKEKGDDWDNLKGSKANICTECGASFKKPAYLKQHMQSHSLERPYACPLDDCPANYRRKDHLTRHLLVHQGKLFKCPNESCTKEFAYQDTMKKHVKEFHSINSPPTPAKSKEQFVCREVGCGKVFKFASKLRKHEDSHVMPESVEAFCGEPGCMKYFSNEKCLKAHMESCHRYMNCETCGAKQLRKNIKRHMSTHEAERSPKKIKCTHDGCSHTFSTVSNLRQHEKAAHLEEKPFACSFSDCNMRFAYKHVRDRHEKSGRHVYCHGDFEAEDEQFRSRPRGGRKRNYPTMDMLIRKRITPPDQWDFACDEDV